MVQFDNMELQNILKQKYNVHMRFVEVSDADFICMLRNDPQLTRFLSSTGSSLEQQVTWLTKYKEREKNAQEYYFIFESEDSERYGVTRLYEFTEHTFVMGTWMFINESPQYLALAAQSATIEWAFNELPAAYGMFDIRKENKISRFYNERFFNPMRIEEDELNYYYVLPKKNWEEAKKRIIKMFQ